MSMFEVTHAERLTGSLTMFDRLIFKGHLTGLYKPGAISAFLWTQGFPMKEFSRYAQAATGAITANAKAMAAQAGRPYIYLDHATTRWKGQTKEDLARSIADRDGIPEGLICVISIVEPASSFDVKPDPNTHRLEARRRQRKCVHHYFYLIDPEFGFMHIRIQAWLPYAIQIYVNGREWLARQLDAAGIGYLRHDNSLFESITSRWRPTCAKVSPTGPGLGPSTPSLAWSTRSWPPSSRPTMAATTGSSIRPRSPPTSCSPDGPHLQAIWPDLVRHAA